MLVVSRHPLPTRSCPIHNFQVKLPDINGVNIDTWIGTCCTTASRFMVSAHFKCRCHWGCFLALLASGPDGWCTLAWSRPWQERRLEYGGNANGRSLWVCCHCIIASFLVSNRISIWYIKLRRRLQGADRSAGTLLTAFGRGAHLGSHV